jgi:hypothetical protein
VGVAPGGGDVRRVQAEQNAKDIAAMRKSLEEIEKRLPSLIDATKG